MSTNHKNIIVDVVNIIKFFAVGKLIISLQKTDFMRIRSALITREGLIVHSQHQNSSTRKVIEGIDYVGDLCLSTYIAYCSELTCILQY